ncbi:MAG TPA: tetratricopeptide repeat protein [Longimicrobiaceae bacterium]|nr:tetratricopeptide repeat protein [Longimicrobiaceae bacterium]
MVGGPAGDSSSALRSLRAASEEVDALSRGALSPEGERRHILRVANAVDRSLRRLLRDDDRADLSIRLRALAPDEIQADAVLAELRRNDRLPMAVAAAIHELFEIRRRLDGGTMPARGDGERAVRAAQGLEGAIRQPRPPVAAPAAGGAVGEPEDDVLDEELEPGGWSRRMLGATVAGGVAFIAIVAAAFYLASDRGPNHMAEGVALFRSGAYTEAAHHFWRFAEANPDDATPHLYLARIHRRMDRPELAAEALREAQRLAPEDAAVHRELGFLLLDTGRADVAVDRFRRALELEGESSEAWVGLIRALRESGRTREADEALAQAPAEVRALISRPAGN